MRLENFSQSLLTPAKNILVKILKSSERLTSKSSSKSSDRKYLTLLEFLFPYIKKNLHILSTLLKWLQQKWYVPHSKTLQPLSNLFELINTKFYINLLFSFHVFVTSLSCFQVFHHMVIIFHSFKGRSINFIYAFLCVL